MICIKLTIASFDNPDFSGVWHKDDVEFEMADIGYSTKKDTAWLEWVLDHNFDSGLEQSLYNAIIDNSVSEIHFDHDGSHIVVVKTLRDE